MFVYINNNYHSCVGIDSPKVPSDLKTGKKQTTTVSKTRESVKATGNYMYAGVTSIVI